MTRSSARVQPPLAVAELTLPERAGGYAKGAKTRMALLKVAHDLLVERGYGALTMRGVAAASGLRMGTLTYHFPTHEHLVAALADAIIRGYEDAFAQIMEDPALPPEARFENLCRLILDDVGTRRTTRIFPELWALSNHDAFVSERVHEMYDRARVALVRAVRGLNPAMAEREARMVSLFISSAMEGIGIFAGHGKPYRNDAETVTEIALRAFLHVCEGARA